MVSYDVRTVAGQKAVLLLLLDDTDRLYRAIYNFNEKHTSGAYYISNYNTIKEAIVAKYGAPVEDEIVPITSQSLVDAVDEITALEMGYTMYYAIWETERTTITLVMSADNYEIKTNINYSDNSYEKQPNTEGL